ncbi:phosphodiesterase [Blastococcus sp. SYSU D00922]
MRAVRRVAGAVTGGAGRLVAVPLGAIARWRDGKPMHPRGAVFDAVLDRRGGDLGVPWLDARASDRVVVRLSRGAGLPAPLPDLLGLAVRLPGDGTPVDLLLTTTGRGPLSRLVPVPRSDTAAVYSSIMGYRSAAGSLRLAAFPEADDVPSDPHPLAGAVSRDGLRFTLAVATGLGPWRPFARLCLTRPLPVLDPDIRFDAVQNPPPGLTPDGPMARFRAPAYARARAERSARRSA